MPELCAAINARLALRGAGSRARLATTRHVARRFDDRLRGLLLHPAPKKQGANDRCSQRGRAKPRGSRRVCALMAGMQLEGRVLARLLGRNVIGLWLFVSCKPALPQTPSSAAVAPAASTPTSIEASRAPTEIAPIALEPAPSSPQSEQVPPADAVATVTPSPDDPVHGNFSLADATAGISGSGVLVAPARRPWLASRSAAAHSC